MVYRHDRVHRIEPAHGYVELTEGLAAPVADPVWFLGRQWQLGEHRGEDAASPIRVEYRAALTPVTLDTEPAAAPWNTPAEALVEGGPEDFWTPGRRAAIGRDVAAAAAAAGHPLPDDEQLLLAGLPVPYDGLDGSGYDAAVLYHRRAELGLDDDWFTERPLAAAQPDRWSTVDFGYAADFAAGGAALALRRHDGGDLDWYSVDASGTLAAPAAEAVSTLATRVTYPGAPNPRWWQIEEARTDLGGYASDRSHFATLLLIEAVVSHGDDWFTFPVQGQVGHVVSLHDVVVHDSFGDSWPVSQPADGWSLFAVAGLDRRAMLLWPTVATPLVGPAIDEVDLVTDEDANTVWAVERRHGGRDLPSPSRPETSAAPPGTAPVRADRQPEYEYRPGGAIPSHWHPYLVEQVAGRRRLVQGRLADLSGTSAVLAAEPLTELLYDPAAGGAHPVHQIEPAAVPVDGLRLDRRYVLGRRCDGTPVLWIQRRRDVLDGPPAVRLELDAARRQ